MMKKGRRRKPPLFHCYSGVRPEPGGIVGVKTSTQRQRLEQLLDNPRCDKNASSAILNVSLQKLAETLAEEAKVAGRDFAKIRTQEFPQFAFEIGNAFEASLFEGNNPLLIEKILVDGGLLLVDSNPQFVKREEGLTTQEYLQNSHALLKKISTTSSGRPRIINGFKLPAQVLPPESTFEVDILVAIPQSDGTHKLVIGEVKVYPDRGGRTDVVQSAGARSQAGLYVHVLRKWLRTLDGVENIIVDGAGFLIFAEPTRGIPQFAALEDFSDQDRRAEVAIEGISRVFNSPSLQGILSESTPDEKIAFVRNQEDQYRESCWGHCAMAEVCFRKAVTEGKTIILGQKTEQQLSSLDLSRAVALADGQAQPATEVEIDIVSRFADARYPEIEGLTWK
jgi:hypothetical protein